MALQGSTAWRGGMELTKVLEDFYADSIPVRLYLYADGGGDRNVVNLKVQQALIAVYLHLDLDELVAARPAAYQSYRNPVERCHAIANLGLQGVAMMRSEMTADLERKMKKCNGNEDVRKMCEADDKFREGYKDSIKEPRELLEYILQRLSLKERSFRILTPGDTDDINSFVHSQLAKIDPDLKNLIRLLMQFQRILRSRSFLIPIFVEERITFR